MPPMFSTSRLFVPTVKNNKTSRSYTIRRYGIHRPSYISRDFFFFDIHKPCPQSTWHHESSWANYMCTPWYNMKRRAIGMQRYAKLEEGFGNNSIFLRTVRIFFFFRTTGKLTYNLSDKTVMGRSEVVLAQGHCRT